MIWYLDSELFTPKIITQTKEMSEMSEMLKGRFFSESMMHFFIAQKMWRKLSWKRNFEIAFCLASADSDCILVSKGRKIQNTKLRIEHSAFLGNGNEANIFFEY